MRAQVRVALGYLLHALLKLLAVLALLALLELLLHADLRSTASGG